MLIPILKFFSHRACPCILQESPFKARRIGAAMVAKNIARIFNEQFVDLEKEKRVLVYCWRGG
jgi:tRNA 2-selenouridine synthase